MSIPDEVLGTVKEHLKRFCTENPDVKVAFGTDVEGQPYLAFESFGDLWDCGWALIGYYLWESYGLSLTAEGLTLWLRYRLPAEPNKAEAPLMGLVRYLWAEEERGGPQVLGFIEPLNAVGFATPNEAQAVAELVKGRFGITNVEVKGQELRFAFEDQGG